MMKYIYVSFLIFAFSIDSLIINAQSDIISLDTFFEPKTEFNSTRFYSALGIGGIIYGAGTYFLYESWYKNNGIGSFHFFDDRGEWLHMDKIGHAYTAFNQSSIMYHGAKWTGLYEDKSLAFGVTMGLVLQTTVEVLDGFSDKWGFSWSDMVANVGGASLFYVQRKLWGEDRITFKVSSWKRRYSTEWIVGTNGDDGTTLENRANDLFGSSFAQRYLKDYNAQTYWMSFNLKSFFEDSSIPNWLNLAIGYSGENMFGGFSNNWEISDVSRIILPNSYNRYGQFFISPDIDLTKLKVKSHFIKTLFRGLNIFKLPMPAIEINTRGEFVFHLLYR